MRASRRPSSLRFVIVYDQWDSRSKLKAIEDVLRVDSMPLRRIAFATAVARAAGRASPQVEYVDAPSGFRAGSAPSVSFALRGYQLILVAEDNVTNQDVIRRQLNLLGYQCEIAHDGVEALAMWEQKRYGVLLTDCHMLATDGFELTAATRAGEAGSNARAPIVAITAKALQGEADRCLAAGMDDYLSKPLDMKAL